MLILVPTSQLVLQIHRLIGRLCSGNLRAAALLRVATEKEEQAILNNLQRCPDIIISTPERLVRDVYKQNVRLNQVTTVVMDEVDVLLSAQFFEPVKILLGALKRNEKATPLQMLLFSATLPPPMHDMIRRTMLRSSHRFVLAREVVPNPTSPALRGVTKANDPERRPLAASPVASPLPAATAAQPTQHSHVSFTVYMVSRVEKLDKLYGLFTTGTISSKDRTIIFCNSSSSMKQVADYLKQRFSRTSPMPTMVVSPNLRADVKSNHDTIVRLFQSGVATVLVSTDVMSRGVDFHNVMNIVHYDLPMEMETWVHRSGRTGRHGLRVGHVFSFFEAENIKMAKPLAAFLRQHHQIVPPKLVEYASQSFVDLFKNSLFHQPTKGFHPRNTELRKPVLGRGEGRIPDYDQHRSNKKFRPQ